MHEPTYRFVLPVQQHSFQLRELIDEFQKFSEHNQSMYYQIKACEFHRHLLVDRNNQNLLTSIEVHYFILKIWVRFLRL